MSKPYNIITIQQYLAGELSAEESYQLERDALQDPMLQDAIDGFEHSKSFSYSAVNTLQQRLNARVAKQQEKRNHFYFGRQRLAIASIAGVLFILTCVLFWMINFPLKKTDTASTVKELSVNLQFNISSSATSGNISPAIGWADYNHYLSINYTGSAIKEDIMLSFRVVNDRPTAIKVLSGQEKEAEKFVRLIENGPDWKGSEGIVVFK